MLNHRHSCRRAVGILLGVLALSASAAQEPTAFTLKRLAEGVYGAVARPGGGAGGNAGVVFGKESVAVIDTFQSTDSARELLDVIAKLTPLPVKFVINTHYHLDHVTGNGVFQEQGAVVLAQRNVRAWARTENLKWWGDKVPQQAREKVESIGLPDVVYDSGVDTYLGQRHLIVRALPGHTGSDSIVVVPDADVVFCGDLFWNHTIPNTTDADTTAWIRTAGLLASEYPEATLFPGHGEPGAADDVRAFAGYLETLSRDVAGAIAAGDTGQAVVRKVLPELRATYGEWAFFDHFAEQNITQAEAEQRGTKRMPQ